MVRKHIPLALAIVLSSGFSLLFARSVFKEFSPPRTAVVDIYEVFENYGKKQEIEARLREEAAKKEEEYRVLESNLKSKEEELQIVAEGSERYDELILERTQLQLEIKKLQKKLLTEFQERHLKEVSKLRDEITFEIKRYAEAHELDLVIEKRFSAEAKGMPPMNWPIVHYVRPEIDITREIIGILNSR